MLLIANLIYSIYTGVDDLLCRGLGVGGAKRIATVVRFSIFFLPERYRKILKSTVQYLCRDISKQWSIIIFLYLSEQREIIHSGKKPMKKQTRTLNAHNYG